MKLKDLKAIYLHERELEVIRTDNRPERLQFKTHKQMLEAIKSWAEESLATAEQRQIQDALRSCREELKRGSEH